MYLEQDITLSYAHNFTINLDELQSTLKTEISATQQWYQWSADVHSIPVLNF